MAKRALQLSCLDQDDVRQKIEQWKVTDPESTHFFRLYHVKDGEEDSDSCSPPSTEEVREGYFNGNDSGDKNKTITDTGQYEQNLLWIHQSKW